MIEALSKTLWQPLKTNGSQNPRRLPLQVALQLHAQGFFWIEDHTFFLTSREECTCGSQWLDALKLPETMHKCHKPGKKLNVYRLL